jgi:hypothetical protein
MPQIIGVSPLDGPFVSLIHCHHQSLAAKFQDTLEHLRIVLKRYAEKQL